MARVDSIAHRTDFRLLDTLPADFSPSNALFEMLRGSHFIFSTLAWSAIFFYCLGQLYSAIFPFIHFGVRWGEQNAFQQLCFYACAGVGALLVGLLPNVVRYAQFGLVMKYLLSIGVGIDRATVEMVIADMYLPPQAFFVRTAIPADLLPPELVPVVANFLERGDIDVGYLTAADCEAMRDTVSNLRSASRDTAAHIVCAQSRKPSAASRATTSSGVSDPLLPQHEFV